MERLGFFRSDLIPHFCGFFYLIFSGIIKLMELIEIIKRNRFYKQTGFTMIELLVTVFIITLLSSLIFASYNSGQRKYVLSQSSQQLVSDLRQAQNMAMSGVDISSYHGYGVHAEDNDNFYIFFADENGDSVYKSQNDTIIKTVNLPNLIKINSVSPSSNLDIFFESPNPVTYINNDSSVGQVGTIVLEIENTSLNKTITVTTAGLIQTND